MATKTEYEGKPAYIEGDKLILQLTEDRKWIVVHKESNGLLAIELAQKKTAMKFCEYMLKNMNLDFKNKEEMINKNGSYDECRNIRWAALEYCKDE